MTDLVKKYSMTDLEKKFEIKTNLNEIKNYNDNKRYA